MSKLQNKIALITGGTTGIGLATAKLFAEEGARVIVTGRNPDTLTQAEEELSGRAQVVRSNTAELGDIDQLMAGIREQHGRLDVLFVNAGIANFAPLEHIDEDHFDRQLGVNVKGALFTVQRALPLLGQGASILFNTSGVGHSGIANTAVYTATKAALGGLTRALAAELAGRGIRVNAVAPGPIETPIYGKLGLPQEAIQGFQESVQQAVALKRFGRAEEIARAALFLASDDASFVTGEELLVDGGWVKVSG